MSKYCKIYHYGAENLQVIDPVHYGTGVTQWAECRHKKTGLDKIYFYIKDKPEISVSTRATRYEVYLPSDWKEAIYDLATDVNNFYSLAEQEIKKQAQRNAYGYEVRDYVEKLIYDNGFKGFINTSLRNPLPHAIVLFYELSTAKPAPPYVAYDWSGNIIEKVDRVISSSSLFAEKIEPASSKSSTLTFSP